MKPRRLVSLAWAAVFAAPLSVIAGEPGPRPGLESCDDIDPTFWEQDGRHVLAQQKPRCDAVTRQPGGWTQDRYEDHWKRFRCTVVRRSGAECSDLWSVAFTCRCERGGRERRFGQMVNCAVHEGRLACRNDCKGKKCAHGAILPALAPGELPPRHVTPQPALEHELGAVTQLLVRTRIGAGMVSQSDEYRFARLEPAECKKVVGARAVSSNNDPYVGCLSRLAEITGDPTVCRHLRSYEGGAQLPRCASWLARSRGDLRACFDVPRPADLWTDLGASAEPSFSGCVAAGIREHPSAAGCALLERTLDGDAEPADRCYAKLAVEERQPSWCEWIVRRGRVDACLWELASSLPDAALCDRLREAGPERRRHCRELAATGPWPRPMRVVRPAAVHDARNRPVEQLGGGGPMILPPGTQVIAHGAARWLDGTRSDAWLDVTFGVQRVALERTALVDAGPGDSGGPQPQWTRLDAAPGAASVRRAPAAGDARRPPSSVPPSAQRGSSPDAAPARVFFVSDTFADDEALDPAESPLSCRRQLVEHFADRLAALEERARRAGQASWSVAGEELRGALSRAPGCRELDARLTHWGLFVDGHEAAWRKVDPSPTLELAVVPLRCGEGLLVPEVRLRISPEEPLLVAGLPGKGRAGEAVYQDLGQPVAAAPTATAPGMQRLALSSPRLGGFSKAYVEKRVATWMADESPPTEQLVVDEATLVLERTVRGKPRRIEVFRDRGFGKYSYSHADIRDVRLLDADFDGDVDVLLSTSNGARYLVLLEGGRPHGEPVRLRRPRDPIVAGC